MTLEETIRKMREKNNNEKFYPLIESMKRRAEKGLLENVTSYDIEKIVDQLGKENNELSSINIKEEIFEINEAIEKFNYLDIDDYSEELLEYLILQNFARDIENINEAVDRIDNYADWNAEREKRRKIANGVAYGVGGAGLATAGVTALGAAKGGVNTATSLGLKTIGSGIAKGATAAAKGIGTFIKTQPLAAGIGLGGLGIAAGYGIYRLIKHLRRKRRERQLSEGFLDESENLILFSSEFSSIIKEAISYLSTNEIEYLKENASDDTKELISMFHKETQTLDEAVTYIDNAGNLKTKSAVDYVKDMHYYDTETQIAKYEKKKKKRDYKLISEEIDIDNIQKLSEMSLEDILNEEIFINDSSK